MASLNTQSRKHARRQQIRPLAGSLLALAIGFGVATAHADDALPKLPSKTPLKVGFAQTESNNPWRLAETKSFKDIAAKCGWQLVMTDANSSNSKAPLARPRRTIARRASTKSSRRIRA